MVNKMNVDKTILEELRRYNEINNYSNLDLDVIIFRMNDNQRIIPKIKTDNFYICDVGISFIIKKSIFEQGHIFIPDGAEDFLYLDKLKYLKNAANI